MQPARRKKQRRRGRYIGITYRERGERGCPRDHYADGEPMERIPTPPSLSFIYILSLSRRERECCAQTACKYINARRRERERREFNFSRALTLLLRRTCPPESSLSSSSYSFRRREKERERTRVRTAHTHTDTYTPRRHFLVCMRLRPRVWESASKRIACAFPGSE